MCLGAEPTEFLTAASRDTLGQAAKSDPELTASLPRGMERGALCRARGQREGMLCSFRHLPPPGPVPSILGGAGHLWPFSKLGLQRPLSSSILCRPRVAALLRGPWGAPHSLPLPLLKGL